MDSELHKSILSLAFPSNVEDNDIERWYKQGFVFNNEINCRFGLDQTS